GHRGRSRDRPGRGAGVRPTGCRGGDQRVRPGGGRRRGRGDHRCRRSGRAGRGRRVRAVGRRRAGRDRRRRVRPAGRAGQQRGRAAGPDAGEDDARGVGRRHPGAPARALRAHPRRAGALEGARRPGAHRLHVLQLRPARQLRPVQLRRRQGRHRRVLHDRRDGGGPAGRDLQRGRPGGAHPDDRGRVRRDLRRRRGLRLLAPGQRGAAGRLPGQRLGRAHQRQGLRGAGRRGRALPAVDVRRGAGERRLPVGPGRPRRQDRQPVRRGRDQPGRGEPHGPAALHDDRPRL
ncbi:MAG: 3-oxoacyl-[acyl-carrier protein] reductase, partial [uncultured Corynebacteriales bacterium]